MSFFCGKRVLVTGGHGFKGSWLCLALDHLGADVLSYGLISNSSIDFHSLLRTRKTKISFVEGNILSVEHLTRTMQSFFPDIVYHLAAEPLVFTGYQLPATVFETNVLGTVNVLEACRKTSSVRAIVNVTTDKVYSNLELDTPFSESSPLGGDDPYSSSKACSELVTNSYYKSFFKNDEVGVSTARAGNVIGAGDFSINRLLPDIMRSTFDGSPLQIRNPDSVRPWQHVLDSIAGYLKLGLKLYSSPSDFSKPYNFGPSPAQVLTVQNIIDIITSQNLLKLDVKLTQGDFCEKKFLILDSSAAKQDLNWNPSSDMFSDLSSIIQGYKLLHNSPSDALNYFYKETSHRLFFDSYE